MTNSGLAQNPIFVVGCPRSGTTLLQALIASQGDLITFPETHFFGSALNLGLLNRDTYTRDEIIAILEEMNTVGRLNITDEILAHLDSVRNNGATTQKDLFELIVQAMAPENILSGLRWIEKTPSNGLCVDRISLLYPEALFVGIVRDPFNTIHSILKNFPPGTGDKCRKIANIWAQHQKKMYQFTQANPKKATIIKYEDLTREPQDSIENICRFLGINFSSQRMKISQEIKRKIVKDFEAWKAPITEKIANNNVPGCNLFRVMDILKIQQIVQPYCEIFGYQNYYKNTQKFYNLLFCRAQK